ncbi:MAG: YgcG family protein [Pseudomonadota bacterium]
MKTCVKYIVLTVMLLPVSSAAQDVPYLTGRVTDNAQILTPETRQSITGLLKAHEDKTTNQIAVLTVPSLDGEAIEDYADAVFQAWELGKKGVDNGLLILIAPNERRMRIEVGYGLEGDLTDGKAGQIIRNIITPRFKQNDYDGGITAGVEAVITKLEGGELSQEISEEKSDEAFFEGPDLALMPRILIGAFIFGIIGLFTIIGVATPGVGWFLYFFLIPFWAMFPIVVVGTRGTFIILIVYVIGFPITKLIFKKTKWYERAKNDLKRKGQASIGGFHFGSGSSSWSSGSSGFSSGSSFSGGGGSSGGGGASGSW